MSTLALQPASRPAGAGLARPHETLPPRTAPLDLPLAPPGAAYRPFFAAAIVIALTAGAGWGAWLLWRIGLAESFQVASVHEVNAHGQAQIFGWVGLFIMGAGYGLFPRLWRAPLPGSRRAVAAVLAGSLIGLIAAALGMCLSGTWTYALPLAITGCLLQIAATAVFVAQIVLTFHRGTNRLEPYVGFIFLSLACFLGMSLMNLWHTYTTMTAATREALVWYVATYQAPLRDLQIHGLAMLMILGVSMRLLPALFGLSAAGSRRAWLALAGLALAIAGEVALFIIYRHSGIRALAAGLLAPWALLLAGVLLVALPWRLWRPFPQAHPSAKFIRAAYGWLVVSLLMLLLSPVYRLLSGMSFSHAYYGATRHAITVGFISLMIMGMAWRLVPLLAGAQTHRQGALMLPFLLVNAGCLMRVVTQILSDFHGGSFTIIGLSGTLEVAGLALWGGAVLMLLLRRGEARAGAACAA